MRMRVLWCIPIVLAVTAMGGDRTSATGRGADGAKSGVVVATTPLAAPAAAAMLETINDDLEVVGSVAIKGPRPWADITAFGAAPNDGTDDTAAIQNAIDSVAGGGTVYIPAGTFKTTGVVVKTNYNGVRIAGSGRLSVLELTGSGTIIRFSASDGGVNNLTLDCHGQSASSGLRVAPEDESQTGTIVHQNFNSFHDLLIASCSTTAIALKAGPRVPANQNGADSGCWYNTFQTISIKYSALGIVMLPGPTSPSSGPNRNNFFSVRVGQATGSGIRIEAGDSNTFYGTGLEGLTGTAIYVALNDGHPQYFDNNNNRFDSTTFEAVGTDVVNQNPYTEFTGSYGLTPFTALSYAGNVGIGTGTSRPSAKLHVEAGGGFDLNPAVGLPASAGGLQMSGKYQGESGFHSNGGVRSNGFQQLGPYSGGISLQRMYFSGSSYSFEDVLNVTASGNVGIGETNPAYKFQVNGSAGATAWNVISSRAFKEDIKTLDERRYREMLTRLTALDLASYRYKAAYGGDGRERTGFIAEELPGELRSKDGKSVDLYELTSYAIGAMKAQQQQIEEQKRALDTQREEIAALRASVERLTAASSARRR
jgi:hypothetical protein